MLSPRVNMESTQQPVVSRMGRFRYGQFLPWLVLAVALFLTLYLWQNARQDTAQHLQSEFDYHVREIAGHIEQRMLAYEYVLRGTQSLFAASQNVRRDDFRSYIANLHLEDNYPGIQGVGFSLIVPPAQKVRHTAAIRKETAQKGYPLYTIHPEDQRDFYTSIIYLEPFSGRNLRAFGYDMYAEQVRRIAMEQARDMGEASISGKVQLVQETEQDVQAGFLMYLPVYRNGIPPGTIDERRTNIVGWAYAPFRMNDLMHGIEGDRADEIDADIYDGDVMSDETLMYDSDNRHGKQILARFSSIKPLDIAGHRWTLHIYSNPVFEERLDTHKTEYIALTGTGASLLLALLTGLLARGRERAVQAARKMNKALIRSEQRAKLAIAASHTAIWDYDLTTGRVYLTEGWAQLLGGDQQPTHTTIQELAARVPEEEQSLVKNAILTAVKGYETSSYQVTHRVRKYDGSYIWVLSEGQVTERKLAEKALQKSHADLSATLQAIPDLLFELNQDGKYLNAWTRKTELLVAQRETLLGRTVSDMLPSEAASTVMSALREAGEKGYSHGQIIHLALPQGDSWFELSTSRKTVTDESGTHFIMLSHDITDRKQAEEMLRKLSIAVEQSPTSVVITDLEANIQYVNPRFTAVTGYSAAEVIGQNPRILKSGQTAVTIYQELWSRLAEGQPWHGELLNKRKNGELYWEETYIAPVKNQAGAVTHYVAIKTDITERKQTEEAVRHMAHHDALTGLPNRAMLSDRLEQALVKAKRDRTHMAVMLLDLDKFKPINDELGHHVGDLLLQEAAKRMQHCVRESDTVARLGGDEFVVLLPAIEAGHDAMSVAEKIRHALHQPFELAGHSLRISVSIGIAIYPDHADSETHLIKCADIAMYQAKKAGKNDVMLYTADLTQNAIT